MELFTKATVASIINPSIEVILLNETDSVAEAFVVLAREKILGAPVMNADTTICKGAIDVLDLLKFVLSVPHYQANWKEEVKAKFQFPLTHVLHKSAIDSFLPISEATPLSQVIQLFASGIHRAPVVSSSGDEIISIVSQYDIIHIMDTKMDSFPDLTSLGGVQIMELISLPQNVISVEEDCLLLKAFDTIIANNISGLAVVNRNGQLIGNISATDFEGITESNFLQLQSTAKDFIGNQKPICCERDTRFRVIIDILEQTKVHRVYVVDAERHPIGIISLTDIMNILFKRIISQKQ